MVKTLTANYAVVQEGSDSSGEAALILNARHGDVEAFNQLVQFYQERIYNLAARILGDQEAAGDITQNTFLTAYLNLPRFHNGSFRSWLYRIATNACYDIYRKNKRHPILSIDHEDLSEERFAPLDDFSNQSGMPETEFERHELQQVVQNALNRLEVDHRMVLILVDQQGFDYQEAAQVLKIPVGTVKSRLSRARLHMRSLLSSTLDRI